MRAVPRRCAVACGRRAGRCSCAALCAAARRGDRCCTAGAASALSFLAFFIRAYKQKTTHSAYRAARSMHSHSHRTVQRRVRASHAPRAPRYPVSSCRGPRGARQARRDLRTGENPHPLQRLHTRRMRSPSHSTSSQEARKDDCSSYTPRPHRPYARSVPLAATPAPHRWARWQEASALAVPQHSTSARCSIHRAIRPLLPGQTRSPTAGPPPRSSPTRCRCHVAGRSCSSPRRHWRSGPT